MSDTSVCISLLQFYQLLLLERRYLTAIAELAVEEINSLGVVESQLLRVCIVHYCTKLRSNSYIFVWISYIVHILQFVLCICSMQLLGHLRLV